MTGVFAGLIGSMDIVDPVVPTPTVVSGGSSDTVSWTAITDLPSGVASATVYQLYVGSTSGFVGGTSQALSSFGASSTTFAIPTDRRNTPTGETWVVTYYIIATDKAGNSLQGTAPAGKNTKPLGTYFFIPNSANTRNIDDTAWLNPTTEGMLGVSTTRLYGCWFYGTDTIKNACKGWNADSGTIYIKRPTEFRTPPDPNRGNSGYFSLMTHDLGSATTAATFGGTVLLQYLSGDGAAAYVALDATARSRLQSGAGQGIGLQGHDSIGFLLGMRDFSGLITLVYD